VNHHSVAASYYCQCVFVSNRADDQHEDLLQKHREVIIQWLSDLLQDNVSVTFSLCSYRLCQKVLKLLLLINKVVSNKLKLYASVAMSLLHFA